jgi:hypothetical protein
MIERYTENSENGKTVVGAAFDSGAEAVANAMAVARSGGQTIGRRTTLGSPVTSLTLSTETTVTITVRLRGGSTFVGHRLILPSEMASSVRVKTVKVNAEDILPSADPIPGEVFSSANQRGGELPFLPCSTNSTIAVELTNETAAAISCCLAIEGVVLQGSL